MPERGVTTHAKDGRLSLGTALDLTSRHVAELAAQDHAHLLATLLDAIPDPILLLRVDDEERLRIEALDRRSMERAHRYRPDVTEGDIGGAPAPGRRRPPARLPRRGPARAAGFRIVRALAGHLGATLTLEAAVPGTRVRLGRPPPGDRST